MFSRTLFSHETSTITYILADEKTKEAVIIDPVLEETERDAKLMKELGFKLLYIIETHPHADHITSGHRLTHKHFPEAVQVYGKNSGVTFEKNLKLVGEGDEIKFGNYKLKVLETPGHTNGCTSFYTPKESGVKYAFTGDALFIRGCGRTDFQGGSASSLYDSIQKLYKLDDDYVVCPAHNYEGHFTSTIAEEKKFNPRIPEGQTKEKFVEIMDNLKLPRPKHIDAALPANLVGGSE